MKNRKLIVISADGLAASSMGAYGSSWNETFVLDSLAAKGVVWDRMVAESDQPLDVLRQCWQAEPGTLTDWIDCWRNRGPIELITDQEALSQSAMDEPFDRSWLVQRDQHDLPGRPCEEIEQTHFAKLFASVLERLEEPEPWGAIWLHSSSLTEIWDAPRWFAATDHESDEQEEPSESEAWLGDPANQTDQVTPASVPWVFDDLTPPSFEIPQDAHPDLAVAWMRTYGCQVRLLDHLIGLMLEAIKPLDPLIVVLGTSGFSLGQNGWIGHRAGPLRSCHHRSVLMTNCYGPIRSGALASTGQLSKILVDLKASATGPVSPSVWIDRDGELDPAIATIAKPSPERPMQRAVTTANWYLVEQLENELRLYLKPDDIDDHNDVSRLREDVVEQLMPLLPNVS